MTLEHNILERKQQQKPLDYIKGAQKSAMGFTTGQSWTI